MPQSQTCRKVPMGASCFCCLEDPSELGNDEVSQFVNPIWIRSVQDVEHILIWVKKVLFCKAVLQSSCVESKVEFPIKEIWGSHSPLRYYLISCIIFAIRKQFEERFMLLTC